MMLQIITEPQLIKELISEAVAEAVTKLSQTTPQPTAQPDQRLTRTQLAEYLNCTLPTVDRYRNEGRIPFYQTGRTVYFLKSDVDNALRVNAKKKGGKSW